MSFAIAGYHASHRNVFCQSGQCSPQGQVLAIAILRAVPSARGERPARPGAVFTTLAPMRSSLSTTSMHSSGVPTQKRPGGEYVLGDNTLWDLRGPGRVLPARVIFKRHAPV